MADITVSGIVVTIYEATFILTLCLQESSAGVIFVISMEQDQTQHSLEMSASNLFDTLKDFSTFLYYQKICRRLTK